MEASQKYYQHSIPYPYPSPKSYSSTNSSIRSSNGSGASTPPPSHLQSQPPKQPTTRSEPSNPYPTTFVQADTSSFKQVVQMLTGSSETAKQASTSPSPSPSSSCAPSGSEPPSKTHIPPNKSGFKLYERRNSLKNFKINPLISVYGQNNSGLSSRNPEILSPSILNFPALVLSPVTPLIPDPFFRSGSASLNPGAEEKAIKEKGFYLHPSPTTTPRDSEPRLLPLFPTTSPRVPGSNSS